MWIVSTPALLVFSHFIPTLVVCFLPSLLLQLFSCYGIAAQDCQVSVWGQWSACSRTCGGGKMHRARVVLKPRKFMGKQCLALSDSRTCHSKPCSSAGGGGSPNCRDRNVFGAWSECTRLCGAGFRYRYRQHIMCSKSTHFIPYKMKFRQKEHCSLRPCVGAVELGWKPKKVDIPPIRG